MSGVGGFFLLSAAKAGAVLLLALVATSLLRRRSASLRHGVLLAGCVGALLLPALQAVMPGWPVGLEGPRVAGGSGSIVSVALVLWAGGTAVFLVRLTIRGVIARRFLARTEPVRDARVLAAAIEARREIGFPGAIRVRLSPTGSVPLSCGLIRHRVILPAAALRWSRPRLRAVLLHEISHLVRRDGLTHLLGELAAAVYWFMPPAWWALRGLRYEREVACDDRVLRRGARPSGYARLLLSTLRGTRVIHPATAALTSRHLLERRIGALLDPRRSRERPRRAVAVLIAVALLLLVPLAGFARGNPVPDSSSLLHHRVSVSTSVTMTSLTLEWSRSGKRGD